MLREMAKGTAFGFMAAGVVVWETAKLVTVDVAKAVVGSMLPMSHGTEFVVDKAVNAKETYDNVTQDMRDMAVRTGTRIEKLREWWYKEN